MKDFFDQASRFPALSLRDLLEAREAYHVHLSNLENVVATAVGRYLVRDSEIRGRRMPPTGDAKKRARGPRTLAASTVTRWSWPCVLVFVRDWLEPSAFDDPDLRGQMVPSSLHLPDGRVVPTCVVWAGEPVSTSAEANRVTLPSQLLGGGYLALAEVQGRERYASIACLVTNGDRTFALTNRHVAGVPGREIGVILRGKYAAIGASAEAQVGKLGFNEAYPELPTSRSVVNLDAGLIELTDANGWTANVAGLGRLRAPVNLHSGNLSLDLIGLPVKAHGGASGPLRGEIRALFYRYRTMGGLDYASDFLIGSRASPAERLRTVPGDSGTLWVLDGEDEPERDLRPVAMQWGGHAAVEGSDDSEFTYALATSVSTVCRVLDVEIIRDWNTPPSPEYWGEIGHYTIGGMAADHVHGAKLKALFSKNRDRVSFDESTLDGARSADLDADADGFFPLADVPDTVWRSGKYQRGSDKGSHFADMDEKGADGRTLFDVSANPDDLRPWVWNDYFDGLATSPAPTRRGALPFRVWQLFGLMVDAAAAKDPDEFLAVAGVLAHYVGDACQPLHSSRYHDGDPDHLVPKTVKGKLTNVPRGSGVHSAYETTMLNRRGKDLRTRIDAEIGSAWSADASIASGHQAAVAVVDLMRRCQTILPPTTIVDFYVNKSTAPSALWKEFQDETVRITAEGVKLLASLWQSAWAKGGGGSIANAKIRTVPKDVLETRYRSSTFAPSYTLPALAKKKAMFAVP